MTRFPDGHRSLRAAVATTMAIAMVVTLSACFGGRSHATSPSPGNELPTRVVIALDGVDYRDIVAAQSRGMFGAFHPASRVISTYPSISDIAWHEILGVQAPMGYQRIYYSKGYNAIIGELFDAIRPIEFENRMDLAFDTKFHHLGAYIISNKVARGEIDKDVKAVFEGTGRRTLYMYNVGPDALQHVRGDLDRYLRHLDEQLTTLMVEYERRTERKLEVVVISDHGHNQARDAKFLPISDALKARGFRSAPHLTKPTDVAFSVDGVTTGFGMFCDPDSVTSVATLLAGINGVDVVTTRETDDRFHVWSGEEEARVERRVERGGDMYRYVALKGDPLLYLPALLTMKRAGVMDADGWATQDAWLKYTSTMQYPVAPPRIVRGHTTVTLNPAPILASLNDKYRVGLGMLSLADRLHPLGGTHGALSSTNSLGVLMTNFMDTHDALTTNVRDQLGGFVDIAPPDWKTPGMRVITTALLDADRLSPMHGMFAARDRDGATGTDGMDGKDGKAEREERARLRGETQRGSQSDVGIELWMSRRNLAWAGDSASFVIDVHKLNADKAGPPFDRLVWPMRTATQSPDHLHYFFSLSRLGLSNLDPDATYEVRVAVHHLPASGVIPRSSESKIVTTLKVRTNATGEVWAY